MNELYPSSRIYLAESHIPKAGRGVFATQHISKGEVIEVCPIIEIPGEQSELLRQSDLINYYFLWGDKLQAIAIALGFGSLYNHSYEPNATYIKLTEERIIQFIALQDIEKDTEITVNYNYGNPNDKNPLWIKEIEPAK
jgi:uncharacterized protein